MLSVRLAQELFEFNSLTRGVYQFSSQARNLCERSFGKKINIGSSISSNHQVSAPVLIRIQLHNLAEF